MKKGEFSFEFIAKLILGIAIVILVIALSYLLKDKMIDLLGFLKKNV